MNQPTRTTPSLWKRLTSPHPSIQDLGEKRRASLIASVSLSLLPLVGVAILAGYFLRQTVGGGLEGTYQAIIIVLILAIIYFLSRTRMYRLGSILFILILIISTVQRAIVSSSELGEILYSFLPIMFIFGIALFNQRGMWMIFGTTMAGMVVIAWTAGVSDVRLVIQSIGVTASIAILSIIVVRFRDAIEQDRLSELARINKELVQAQGSLEQRVNERTADLNARTGELEEVNRTSQRRAKQFEAITRVARDIASTRNLDELLPRICEAVSEQFGFYHTGIFLNDEESGFSVLRAANSTGGKDMLARNHMLKIGAQGIVGYVTGTGNPRIALNVGEDAIYFNNPDLPETRSEMAVPLKIASKTIGALDVQSTEAGAFKTEDITALSLLADQIGIAIDNARLYESTIRSLEQSQSQYRRYLQDEWGRYTREEELLGYRYVAGTSAPLEEPLALGEAGQVVQEGRIFQRKGTQASDVAELAVPVRLRGQVIGVISVSVPGRKQWSDDDLDIAEAVADRLALAMENARLFQTTNKRAERERIISGIASKLSGNIRIETLLETTAQELSQALNGSEVLIQLQAANPAGGQA